MFEIKKRSPRAGYSKYPFDLLQIDDAFIVPAGWAAEANVRAAAYKAGRDLDRTFHVGKRRNGDLECWRSA